MASTCVNHIGLSSDSFLDRPSSKLPTYAWLSPRKSLSKVYLTKKDSDVCNDKHQEEDKKLAKKSGEADLQDDSNDFDGFEFRLEDNFTMLPADELFFDGKLMPLHLSRTNPEIKLSEQPRSIVMPPQLAKLSRNEIAVMDPYLFSPKAPRCTTSWKELLGLKKLYLKEKEKEKENENNVKPNSSKSFRNLLHRSSKTSMSSSSSDSSVNLPLLKDENEYISVSSSRLSLSSSSSSHDHDDLPRLSLDTDNKPLPRVSIGKHQCRPRRSTSAAMRRQTETDTAAARGISMDSPRMNASGKIIFHSLERSSSSPSSYGGPRYKHSSVQRSYSANVRVTPVLNVPVCSKSGTVFGLFGSSSSSSSHPKRDSFGSINGPSCSKGGHNNQSTKHRKDRN